MQARQVNRVPGTAFISFAVTDTPTLISLEAYSNPIGTRINSLAGIFELCRCTSMTVTYTLNSISGSSSNIANTTSDLIVAFDPFQENTGVATYEEVSEFAVTSVYFCRQTVPSKLQVPRKVLIGENPLKWFPTRPTTSEEIDFQGNLYFCCDGKMASETLYCNARFDYVYEFTAPTSYGYESKISSPHYLKKDSSDIQIVPDFDDEKQFPPPQASVVIQNRKGLVKSLSTLSINGK